MSRLCSILLLWSVIVILSGCTAGRNAFNTAEKLEKEGRYDEAISGYAEAIIANPGLSEYRLRFLHASEKGAQKHLTKGEDLLARNRFDEALRELEAASALDPSLDKAAQLAERARQQRDSETFRREADAFEKENKIREAYRSYQRAVQTDPGNRLAREGVQRLLAARKTRLDGYDLSLKSQQPITLKFKEAKLKEVFAIVTQLSGINFIFDEGVKDQNVTIHLEKASFSQAVEVLTGMYKLGRKVLNDSTIIIYPKTPDKVKNYEEMVVRTFYLNSLDAKKAVNLLRTMLQLKKIYVNEENNGLVIRDTPETIAVAERIIEANDIPEAEVLLEVEIIEISKKNQEKFGLALSRYSIAANLANPTAEGDVFLSDSLSSVKTSTGDPTTVQTDITNLLKLDFFGRNAYYTVPNATFNFGKTLANGETLSNPKLRVKNREKAKFNVGTRQPITTTSTTGTSSGYSVNVQYVDVGVKMNAEPTIKLNNEVSLKVGLEVSSITNKETVGTEGATTVVTIGTRNLDTVLNLKDGETTIIGGLIQDSKSKSKNKIMFLGDLPVIGPLLSDSSDTNDKTELILAITPRIIKAIEIPDMEALQFWSGKDDEPSTVPPYVSFAEEPDFSPAASQKPLNTSPAAAPAAAPDQAMMAPTILPGQVPVTAAAAESPAVDAGPAEILWSLPEDVRPGTNFTLGIAIENANNLHAAPLVIGYDTAKVSFVSAAAGPLLAKGGQSVTFKASADAQAGTVSVSLARPAGAAGVSGGEELLLLSFRALQGGEPAQFTLRSVAFTDPQGKALPVNVYDAFVEIQ